MHVYIFRILIYGDCYWQRHRIHATHLYVEINENIILNFQAYIKHRWNKHKMHIASNQYNYIW